MKTFNLIFTLSFAALSISCSKEKPSPACVSAKIEEGLYTATQKNLDVFSAGSSNQVTISKVQGEANVYLITDLSGGGYHAVNPSFPVNQPATITTDCNAGGINVTGTPKGTGTRPFGPGIKSGTWDPASKTLVVHYDDIWWKTKQGGQDLFTTFVKN